MPKPAGGSSWPISIVCRNGVRARVIYVYVSGIMFEALIVIAQYIKFQFLATSILKKTCILVLAFSQRSLTFLHIFFEMSPVQIITQVGNDPHSHILIFLHSHSVLSRSIISHFSLTFSQCSVAVFSQFSQQIM
jgi:hypothetical protein